MSLSTPPPTSLCILRLSAIGDVTHVLPMLRSIQKQWSDCKITWVIGKLEHQLVYDIPNVEFIIYDKSKGNKANLLLKNELNGRQFDILLHMQISLRASLASRHIKAKQRIGFDFKRARNFQWLFTNKKIAYVPQQHVLDSFLEFPKRLGINTDTIEWNILISNDDTGFIKSAVPTDKYIVINASASNNIRNWSAEHYAAVIDHLHEKYNLHTVLSGGPVNSEIELSQSIHDLSINKPTLLTGKTTLKQLAALLASARLVIAPDTGPAHIANALGTPVIGLYANSNPYRTGPYSNIENTVNQYPAGLLETYGN